MRSSEITPAPTDDEAVAIVAAVEALWPRSAIAPSVPPVGSAWRFSGRWWHRDRLAPVDRPWS